MKLIVLFNIVWQVFSLVLYCLNLCKGYGVEFIVFGKRVRDAGNSRMTNVHLGKF